RVLLLDADMRMSNIHKVLKIQQSPGLSNLLVGLNNTHVVQPSGIHKNLNVITAGEIPPNPSELLNAKRMQALLELLSDKMDFIIIDLPPIDAVTDALIVSKLTDGMIIVARQNYVDKRVLDNTVRQLRFHDANILGFVMNGTEIEKKYYRKSYYKNYYSSEKTDNE
ncbi:MAG: CpsD/CapB family tyrosine-protein kinase, partial [Clostridia bacterium]|nr:CpsD/CapB family tyrosine-protein kinase [Clostridia bacterium]